MREGCPQTTTFYRRAGAGWGGVGIRMVGFIMREGCPQTTTFYGVGIRMVGFIMREGCPQTTTFYRRAGAGWGGY